ncbi:MAG: FumA C-terminus/TtdB family hydratase beta subunit [Candidatus Omnitrophota bacterium]
MREIYTPLTQKAITELRAADTVSLTGIIYTARDQAHKRLVEALNQNKRLPVDLNGQVIYYCGPTLTPKGKVIGSCGPTTSSRMDSFTPALLKAGLSAMIGKGRRSLDVVGAIRKYRAVYFLTYAGCGALLSGFVKESKLAAYPELGPEAIYRLYVERFPLIVGVDSKGRNVS